MTSPIIHPLHIGSITGEMSTFTYMRNVGRTITFPVIVWYVEGADARILVDTAAPPPDQLPSPRPYYSQPPEQHLERALASLGVRPDDVEVVVLTHLHWDHCLNAHLFPKARFVVQREELRYAIAPLPVHYPQYNNPCPGTRAPLPPGLKVEVIAGDRDLVKGVSLVHLPGHTPGMQGVRVETGESVYLIAGDNVPFYENWEGEPPDLPHIPSNLHVDLEAYMASLTRMETLADRILPGHDPRVFDRKTYP